MKWAGNPTAPGGAYRMVNLSAPPGEAMSIRTAARSRGRVTSRRLGRFPLPGPSRTYEVSAGGASGRSGQVIYDQCGRLTRVVIADAEDAERPRGG
jgi:hypothetical protein